MQLNDTVNLNGILQDLYFEGKFNSATFQKNDLLRIINKYYFQMQAMIRGINEDFYLIVAVTNLVTPGDGSYTLPNGNPAPAYEKIKSLWAAFNPKDPTAPLVTEYERVSMIGANQVTDPAYEFSIPTAIMFGNYFVLHPLPNTGSIYPNFPMVTNGVKMYYIPQQTPLVNDTDMPNIFPDYHDFITWGALTEIAARLGDKALEAKAIKKFKERADDLRVYASNRVLDLQGSGVIEGQDSSGGWCYPYGQQSMS